MIVYSVTRGHRSARQLLGGAARPQTDPMGALRQMD